MRLGRGGRRRRCWAVAEEVERTVGWGRWWWSWRARRPRRGGGRGMRDRFASLGRPKRLFIIVNPYGGKRGGRRIFQTEVLPLIEAAGILYTMQETKYRLHAQETAHLLDLRKYDGIICVSGDGVLVEVVNGLLQREDWNTAIKVPLGIIPAAPGYEGFGDPVGQITSCKSNGASTGVQGDISNDCNDETCAYSGPSIDEADLEWIL